MQNTAAFFFHFLGGTLLSQLQAAIVVDLYEIGELIDDDGWVSPKAVELIIQRYSRWALIPDVLKTIIEMSSKPRLIIRDDGSCLVLSKPKRDEINFKTPRAHPATEDILKNIRGSVQAPIAEPKEKKKADQSIPGPKNNKRTGRPEKRQASERQVLCELHKFQQHQPGPFTRQEIFAIMHRIDDKILENPLLNKFRKKGFIERTGRGLWTLTEQGKKVAI